MSKTPNRLGIYHDVQEILDAALAAGGGTYTCSTHGQAVHWRQRAYRFRKLFAEIHGARSASSYDRLTLPRIEPDSCEVHIHYRQHVGTFTPAESGITVPDILTGDELLDEALRLAASLEGDSQ